MQAVDENAVQARSSPGNRGVEEAIARFVESTSVQARPVAWTKTAGDIPGNLIRSDMRTSRLETQVSGPAIAEITHRND